MARTAYFHVGLPKTGTTYLQSLLWGHRDALREQGVLLPGESSREHLWATGVVREDPRLDRRGPRAPGAWDRLLEEANAWPGTVLFTHEFFAAASAEQAARAMAAVTGAECHVVVTAREAVSLVTARWQEWVKNGETTPIDDYPVVAETDPANEWDWGTLDLADVLARWGATLPPERVHVLTMPEPGEPRDTLWQRFAGVVGIDPTSVDTRASQVNQSLGVVEVELLRRINADLEDFSAPVDRGNWIRGYLAQEKLVPRHGEKFWPSPHRVEQLRERGDRAADLVAERGYHVVGDVERLRTPAVLDDRRHPESVTDSELVGAATATIAAMLTDVRRLTRQRRAFEEEVGRLRQELELTTASRLARRLRRMWPRS